MKRVRITHVSEATRSDKVKGGPGIKYTVWIGNGYTGYFSSKKKAREFISQSNKFIQARFLELNQIYGSLLMEYRKVWPLLDHDKKGSGALRHRDQSIRQKIKTVDERFEWVLRYDNWKDSRSNHYIFKDLFRISGLLQGCCLDLMDFYEGTRNNPLDVVRIRMIGNQVKDIQDSLENYGFNELEVRSFDKETFTVIRAIS